MSEKTKAQVAEEVLRLVELERTDEDAYLDKLFAGEIHTGYPAIDKPWYKYFTKEGMKYNLPKMKILDYVKSHPDWTKGRTAFSYYGHEISYDKFFKHVDEAARVLTDMGIRKGDRILCLMPNIPETAYLFYAASEIGAVSDYIDPRPDSIDLKVSARKCLSLCLEEGCKFVITLDSCYLAMIQPNEQEWKDAGIDQLLVVTAADSMTMKAKMTYAKFDKIMHGKEAFEKKMAKQKKLAEAFEACKANSVLNIKMYKDEVKRCKHVEPAYVEYEPDMMVAITHTSGTTGRPKPLPTTHDALNAYACQPFNTDIRFYPGQRYLHLLPYFAAYGIANQLHGGLAGAVCMVEVPEIGPNDLGKLIVLNKTSFNSGIPTWCYAMIKDPWMQDKDLSFVDWLSAGGTSMSASEQEEVTKFLQDHGSTAEFLQGHGMSETLGSATYSPYGEPGSLGVPWPQTIYAIVDPETKEMLAFEEGQEWLEGELIICTEANTKGELDGKKYVEHRTYFGKDYIVTGDIARMRYDGLMFFDSRKDRGFARYDGFNVRPGKLEEVINSFDEVQTCVISPFFSEEVGGNMIKAYIVPQDGKEYTPAEQADLVEKIVNEGFIENEDLSSRQIPTKFHFIPAMPLTPGGKIDYAQLDYQPLSGEEVTVILEETNVSLDGVTVLKPENA